MARGKGAHGSPRSTEQYHAGRVAGAGEIKTGEPGSFARGVKAVVGQGMSKGPPSGAAPRGMKTYNQE